MEGTLFKKGRGKNFTFVKPWASRVFKLDHSKQELSYYAETKGKLSFRGMVSTKGGHVTESNDSTSGKPFSFEFTSCGGSEEDEIMVLAAPDEEQKTKWMNALAESSESHIIWLKKREVKIEEVSKDSETANHQPSFPLKPNHSESSTPDLSQDIDKGKLQSSSHAERQKSTNSMDDIDEGPAPPTPLSKQKAKAEVSSAMDDIDEGSAPPTPLSKQKAKAEVSSAMDDIDEGPAPPTPLSKQKAKAEVSSAMDDIDEGPAPPSIPSHTSSSNMNDIDEDYEAPPPTTSQQYSQSRKSTPPQKSYSYDFSQHIEETKKRRSSTSLLFSESLGDGDIDDGAISSPSDSSNQVIWVKVCRIKVSQLMNVERISGENDPYVEIYIHDVWHVVTNAIPGGGGEGEWVTQEANKRDMQFCVNSGNLSDLKIVAKVYDQNALPGRVDDALIGCGELAVVVPPFTSLREEGKGHWTWSWDMYEANSGKRSGKIELELELLADQNPNEVDDFQGYGQSSGRGGDKERRKVVELGYTSPKRKVLTMSDIEIDITVVGCKHTATALHKRVQLLNCFHQQNSSLVDYDAIQKQLQQLSESDDMASFSTSENSIPAAPLASTHSRNISSASNTSKFSGITKLASVALPYLPLDGCTWKDVKKHLQFCERNSSGNSSPVMKSSKSSATRKVEASSNNSWAMPVMKYIFLVKANIKNISNNKNKNSDTDGNVLKVVCEGSRWAEVISTEIKDHFKELFCDILITDVKAKVMTLETKLLSQVGEVTCSELMTAEKYVLFQESLSEGDDKSMEELEQRVSELQEQNKKLSDEIYDMHSRNNLDSKSGISNAPTSKSLLHEDSVSVSPDVNVFRSHEDEFNKADVDGDGTIGREEWRRWMAEKQQLIEMFNKEKEKLVKDNKNLRLALNHDALQTLNYLSGQDDQLEASSRDLIGAHEEVSRLKIELEICKTQLSDIERGANFKEHYGNIHIKKKSSYENYSGEFEEDFEPNSGEEEISPGGHGEVVGVVEGLDYSMSEENDLMLEKEREHKQAKEESFLQRFTSSRKVSPIRKSSLDNTFGIYELSTSLPPSINEIYSSSKQGRQTSSDEFIDAEYFSDIDISRARSFDSKIRNQSSSNNEPNYQSHHAQTSAPNANGPSFLLRQDSHSPMNEHPLRTALRSKPKTLYLSKKVSGSNLGGINSGNGFHIEGNKLYGGQIKSSPPYGQIQQIPQPHLIKKHYATATDAWQAKTKNGMTAPSGAVRNAGQWKYY